MPVNRHRELLFLGSFLLACGVGCVARPTPWRALSPPIPSTLTGEVGLLTAAEAPFGHSHRTGGVGDSALLAGDLASCGALLTTLSSDDVVSASHADPSAEEEGAAEGSDHDEHSWHRNHVALFVGGMTPISEAGETSFALGVDYERRLTQLIGVEGLADFTFGEHSRDMLFAANLTLRPLGGLKLIGGPGFEVAKEKSTGDTHVDFVLLVGAAYEFHIGPVTLAPTFHFDFLGGTQTNVTYGLGIGTGF